MGYKEIFMQRLRELSFNNSNVDEEDTSFTHEWVYAGGSVGSHFNYFKLRHPEMTVLPEHSPDCLCSHPIEENCYIENKHNGRIAVVGNCCIRKFLPEENQGRTCENCGATHRNRKNNICNDCRDNSIVKVGKYSGSLFADVDDIGYHRWVLNTEVFEDLLPFKEFLLDKYGSVEEFNALHPHIRPQPLPETVFDVGKHKGRTFEDVAEKEKRYVSWVKKTEFENNNSTLAVFKEWILTLK
jgi:hypothetical protein